VLDILLTYFFFILAYPVIVCAAALEAPQYAAIWLVAGVGVLFLVLRYAGHNLGKAWFTVWFLPGTVICAGSSLTPWPNALVNVVFIRNGCCTMVSLAVCLALNFGLVYGSSALFLLWRKRRVAA